MASLLKKTKLADVVIEEIKRMIRDSELHEGDKLPNQNAFSEQLGVSRPSLREALHTLTLMGVIEQKPGAGTILKSGNPDLWNEYPARPMLSDSDETLELLEARRDVEAIMTRYAVERITDKEIFQLSKAIDRMKISLQNNDSEDYMKQDILFHYQLANASHNRYIIHMFITIRSLMEEFMKETFEVIPSLIHNSYYFHTAIFNAIKNRDKKQAVKYIRDHISDIEKSLKEYYSPTCKKQSTPPKTFRKNNNTP